MRQMSRPANAAAEKLMEEDFEYANCSKESSARETKTHKPLRQTISIACLREPMIEEEDCSVIVAMPNDSSNRLVNSPMSLLVVPFSARQGRIGGQGRLLLRLKFPISKPAVNGGARPGAGSRRVEELTLQLHLRVEVGRERQSRHNHRAAHVV